MAATGADFRIGGARAFYDVGGDYVQVPPQPAFTHQIDFYRTALHELGHWTGSKERLARDQSGRFGSALYAQIGRAHVCTPVTNAHLVCRLLLEKKKQTHNNPYGATQKPHTTEHSTIHDLKQELTYQQ